MSMITRNLMPLAISRQSNQAVQFLFKNKTANLDGSFQVANNDIVYMARITDLTSDDIQRLIEGGITLHKGANVSIPYEFDSAPDSVIWQGSTYRIVQSAITEGCSIFTVDKGSIGYSNLESQA